jgi:dynein heavy chain
MCNDFLDDVKDISFPVEDLIRSMSDEEKGPYQFVFLQECEYMNVLVFEMARSLAELQLGFRGELTMSPAMESLADCLHMEKIPPKWSKYGFPSTRALMSWLTNLKERCEQLNDWVGEPLSIPKVTDISRLFNPQSFLTAIQQLCCQQQQLELNKLEVFTEVTKRDAKGVEAAAREGVFVTGMFLEGARWDTNANCLEDSKPKEMFFKMPVVNCKAGLVNDREEKNIYICPTYCVPTRRPYYVFPAQLRTKAPPAKWVLGGVAIILDVGVAI